MLNVKNGTTIQHYDVRIEPVKPRKEQDKEKPLPVVLCRKVWKALVAAQPDLAGVVFDGRTNAFTIIELGGTLSYDITVTPDAKDGGKPEDFKVKLAHAQSINLDRLHEFVASKVTSTQLADVARVAMQSLDVLLRAEPMSRPNVIVGGVSLRGKLGRVMLIGL